MTQNIRKIILVVVIVSIASAIFFLESKKIDVSPQSVSEDATIELPFDTVTDTTTDTMKKEDRTAIVQEKTKKYDVAKELTSIAGYINTDDNLKIQNLIGKKVILLDIWTYSCINCIRTIPHLNRLYQKYKDDGFVLIGVHTPEFEFEQDRDNVLENIKKEGVTYPVALDNDYATWNAYENQFWPASYLIDAEGNIQFIHFGDG